jgi:hypothetical protein
MTATASKLGADVTENEKLIKALADADWSGVPIGNKALIAKAVQVLKARQPAAIDKQEAVAEVVGSELETAIKTIGYRHLPIGTKLYAAPLANETSKPGPSVEQDGRGLAPTFGIPLFEDMRRALEHVECVYRLNFVKDGEPSSTLANLQRVIKRIHTEAVEQDERGALAQAAIRMLEGYAESYESMSRMDGGGNKVQCSSVAFDIRHNMAGWIKARAASTSANVAQGAEAVAEISKRGEYWIDKWFVEAINALPDGTHQLYAAPPAQTALADDARECLADVASHYRALYAGLAFQLNEATVSENSDDMTYWKHEIKALERMYAQAERALTAAQSASGASGDTK